MVSIVRLSQTLLAFIVQTQIHAQFFFHKFSPHFYFLSPSNNTHALVFVRRKGGDGYFGGASAPQGCQYGGGGSGYLSFTETVISSSFSVAGNREQPGGTGDPDYPRDNRSIGWGVNGSGVSGNDGLAIVIVRDMDPTAEASLQRDLVARWLFNEPKGYKVRDLVDRSSDGLLMGDFARQEAVGLHFSQSAVKFEPHYNASQLSRVIMPNFNRTLTGTFSLSFWVRPTAAHITGTPAVEYGNLISSRVVALPASDYGRKFAISPEEIRYYEGNFRASQKKKPN